jgi:hypothetical protein
LTAEEKLKRLEEVAHEMRRGDFDWPGVEAVKKYWSNIILSIIAEKK